MDTRIAEWNDRFAKANPQEVLEFFSSEYGDRLCLSSSMGAEDQVLTDMLVKINPSIRIFTLDTGRLFPETLNLIHDTCLRYKTAIEVFFPDYRQVQKMVKVVLCMNEIPKPDDAADALAIAICHANSM